MHLAEHISFFLLLIAIAITIFYASIKQNVPKWASVLAAFFAIEFILLYIINLF